MCRCMTIFEIPAPINHCSVTCFTPYLLSSFSSVPDCQCCVNCLLFWCSICSAFWQAPTKCSQLTFGQQTQWTFLTMNLMPTYVFPCSLFQAALLTVITWSHLASVVTVEWKQLSHKPEHCFQLLLFFFSAFHHISFCSKEAHLTLVLLAFRQKMLLSWKNEKKSAYQRCEKQKS